MAHREIAIADARFWPPGAVKALHDHWLTTVQQVVALAAAPNGVDRLAALTRLEPEVMHRLVAKTRDLLPVDELMMLETPVDTREFGLGANDPEAPQ
jgi:hypothetical protein